MIVVKEEKDERGNKEGNLSIGLAIMCLADFVMETVILLL